MKNEKKPRNVGIWAFLNKIPAGTMFVPLVISAIICTITVECGLGTGVVGEGQTLWEFLGNPMKDLFGKTGQMPLITSKLLKLLYYKKPTNYKLMNLQIPRQTYR